MALKFELYHIEPFISLSLSLSLSLSVFSLLLWVKREREEFACWRK